MKRLSAFVFVIAAGSTTGCRAHPCGDESADLPSVFGDAPVLVEDGKVCHAQSERAIAMYWGDSTKMSQIITLTLAQMDGAGWRQHESKGEYTATRDPKNPLHIFRKGDQEIAITFSPSQTPRFGSKMWTDSITVTVSHRVLTEKERRGR